MKEITSLDFNHPMALNLDDRILLRDLWRALGEPQGDYSKWSMRKLKYYSENDGVEVFDKKVGNPLGGRPTKETYVSVQVGIEIAANGHGSVGHKVRRFLGACLKLLIRMKDEELKSLKNREMKSLPRVRKGKVNAPIFQDTLFGTRELVGWRLQDREKINSVASLMAQERQLRRTLKGAAIRLDEVVEEMQRIRH